MNPKDTVNTGIFNNLNSAPKQKVLIGIDIQL